MEILFFSLITLLIYMSGLFVVSLITKNNGVADIGYGVAFMIVIAATFLQAPTSNDYLLILIALPFIWALRLASRIYQKNKGKPEDFRYKAWREEWGNSFVWRSYLQIYMLQGLVVFIVALPVTLVLIYPATVINGSLFYIGVSLWVIGFYFEAMGDFQLDRFIKNPANKGKIMTSGLWKYSRHPNYFGESTMWFGIAIISLSLSSIPFVAIVSPLLITFLLLKVSGVPMLEKHFAGNPDWEEYKKKTSVFIPLPPKFSK